MSLQRLTFLATFLSIPCRLSMGLVEERVFRSHPPTPRAVSVTSRTSLAPFARRLGQRERGRERPRVGPSPEARRSLDSPHMHPAGTNRPKVSAL